MAQNSHAVDVRHDRVGQVLELGCESPSVHDHDGQLHMVLAAGGSLPLLKGKRCFMLWSCDCCDEGAAIMYQGVLKRLREF